MDISKNFKGIAYSVVIIVAVVGVLGALIGMSYQSSVDSGTTITEKAAQDLSTQKLENTKATIAGALRFSSMSAAMDVSNKGGTADPLTYWECNSEPQPPELNEVLFALSNTSIQYVNTYMKTLREDLKEKNIDVSDCDCITLKEAEKSVCMNEDCESYGSGIKEERIDVTFPTTTNYKGGIEADISPIRFWMFYYRLYDYFKENKLLQIIAASMQGNCPLSEDMKYEVAYRDVCKDLIEELSRHDSPGGINCTTITSGEHPEILCTHKYVNCRIIETGAPHTSCEREPKEDLCFSTTASMQGSTKGILIELTDKKFNPLGTKPMVWNLNAVLLRGNIPECTPIDQ